MSLIEAYLTDGQVDIKIIWFNQPFLMDTLKEGDKIIVAGTVERDWDGCLLKSPMFEKCPKIGMIPFSPIPIITQK